MTAPDEIAEAEARGYRRGLEAAETYLRSQDAKFYAARRMPAFVGTGAAHAAAIAQLRRAADRLREAFPPPPPQPDRPAPQDEAPKAQNVDD